MAVVKKTDPAVAGHTQSDQRKFLLAALVFLLPSNPVVHIPAVGQFSLARVALEAGYKPENVYLYDENLYSGLIGNLIDPTAPEPKYMLTAESEYLYTLLGEDTPTLRAAFVIYQMKLSEYDGLDHLRERFDDLVENAGTHILRLADQIEAIVGELKGVHYIHRTMPDVVCDEHGADEVVLVPQPLYSGHAVKGFKYGDYITYESGLEAYRYATELEGLYEASKESDAVFFWYHNKSVDGFPVEEVVFSKEYKPTKLEYWLCSKPSKLEGFKNLKAIVSFHRQPFAAYPLPVWGLDDEVRPDSTVRFVTVNQNVELYYRDLWAHRLGSTAGDRYMLMIVDEKVFAAIILQLTAFSQFKSEWIFEQSGFSAVSTRYQRMVRLLMWAVTCQQWGDDVMRLCFRQNRFMKPIGCETTCLSKYRKQKGNLGILKDRFRVRMPNGLYRIIQNAEFRQEGYTECIARFLEEQDK